MKLPPQEMRCLCSPQGKTGGKRRKSRQSIHTGKAKKLAWRLPLGIRAPLMRV